jgi:hypothetical protein
MPGRLWKHCMANGCKKYKVTLFRTVVRYRIYGHEPSTYFSASEYLVELLSVHTPITQYILKLAWSRSRSASLRYTLLVSKCISKLIQLPPPSASLSALDHGLPAHLQPWSINVTGVHNPNNPYNIEYVKYNRISISLIFPRLI